MLKAWKGIAIDKVLVAEIKKKKKRKKKKKKPGNQRPSSE
jgi:hypothetical protein